VRFMVAENPNTPVEILAKLSQNSDRSIRIAVSGNPNAPIESLLQLAKDPDSVVRHLAQNHPNYPNNLADFLKFDWR